MNQTTSQSFTDFTSLINDDDYFYEIKRLESFKIWPFGDEDICNKKELAKAGFYWCGNDLEPDSAACFMCLKQLDNWESSDDPWLEHKKHAPQCSFVKVGKVEDDMTVNEFLQMAKTFILNKLKNEHDTRIRLHQMKIDDRKENIHNHFHRRTNC